MSAVVLPEIQEKGYAHPDTLVTTQWVADHLNDPSIRLIESNEDILLYDTGHIPGAVKLDWRVDCVRKHGKRALPE